MVDCPDFSFGISGILSMKYWIPGLIIILTLAACNGQQTSNPKITPRYFPETGHTVRGEFLRFFNAYGGVESFGYPLTGEIIVDGWRVQYFEKGRLEYHPENEPAYRVTIGWLGDLLHRRRPPIPPVHIPPRNDPRRRYFSETGHTLSGDFLDYFEAHGGSVRFGLPISEPFLWQGRLAQDFQSARFIWTPDTDPPVTLEDIGRVHLNASGLDEAR
jgi:hypothetical protein